MAHHNRLSNARVLVFGGTSGIGFGVASMAVSNGANVIISGSKQPKVDEKVALLRSLYPDVPANKITGHALDLLEIEKLEAGALETYFDSVTQHGDNKIDHIAFTAGDTFSVSTVIETMTAETAMHGFKVRYLVPLLIAKSLVKNPGKYMPVSNATSISLTGGTNTQKPMPGWSIRAGQGGAVEALSRGLAVDLSPIRVNLVEPGAVQTELLDAVFKSSSPEVLENMKNGWLTGAFGRPEDLAEAYGWFMKDQFVTGVIASSNGGRMLK